MTGSENEGSQVPALVLEKPQCAHLKWAYAPWEQEEGSRKHRGNRSGLLPRRRKWSVCL